MMNNQLKQKIVDLVIEYILAESQAAKNGRDIDKVVKIIADIQSIKDVRDTFKENTDFYSAYRDNYRFRFNEILRNEPDSERLNYDLEVKEFQSHLLKELLEKLLHEKSITTKSSRIAKLEDEITELEEKIRYGKYEGRVTTMDKIKSLINLPYLVVLFILIISLIGIYIISSKSTLNITITFSVGEIIGAILAGTGIAVAGISYATKKPETQDRSRG